MNVDVPRVDESDGPDRRARIRDLNDAFRRSMSGGRVMLTAGVGALPDAVRVAIIAAVRGFASFDADNDPHGEHDFGALTVAGHRLFWKIECYDRALRFGSPDPADPASRCGSSPSCWPRSTEVAGRKLRAGDVPSPGPWLVRGEADEGALPADVMSGVEPATEDRPGGWPYLIRQDRPLEVGGSYLHLATGIQRLADAKLMAAAPELAATMLRLLTSPELTARNLDPQTRTVIATAWDLLVRVAPQLEI